MPISRPSGRLARQTGFSLLELLAVVTIIGILAVVILPRLSRQTLSAKGNVCNQYTADLNAAVETFYFETQTFPGNLEELHPIYYPEAIPVCPVTHQPYVLDIQTHRIGMHMHP